MTRKQLGGGPSQFAEDAQAKGYTRREFLGLAVRSAIALGALGSFASLMQPNLALAKAISPYSSQEAFLEYVKKNMTKLEFPQLIKGRQPVFPQLIKDRQLIYFGEKHSEKAPARLLAERMPEFAQAGVKLLFCEKAYISDQELFDTLFREYSAAKETAERSKGLKGIVREALMNRVAEKIWECEKKVKQSLKQSLLFEKTLDENFGLIKAAMKNGIKVVCMSPDSFRGETVEEKFKELNEIEARIIAGCLQRENMLKSMIFVGGWHAEDDNLPAAVDRLLGERKIKPPQCVSFQFIGVSPDSTFLHNEPFASSGVQIEDVIAKSSLGRESFLFPSRWKEYPGLVPKSDYFVFLPRTEP